MKSAPGMLAVNLIEVDDADCQVDDTENSDPTPVHEPICMLRVEETVEEAAMVDALEDSESDNEDQDVPELTDDHDDESNSKSGDTFLGEEEELEELDALLDDSEDSLESQHEQKVLLRCTKRENATTLIMSGVS